MRLTKKKPKEYGIMTSSNTADNSKKKVRGKPFQKGDPRINRKGRPKSFDKLRELARQIAHEVAQSNKQDIVINGHKVTVTEAILRSWAQSKNPKLQQAFIEIAFGKVPNKMELTGEVKQKLYAVISPDDWDKKDTGDE